MKISKIINKYSGFTLTETLLYLAIFAVIAGLTFPMLYIVSKSGMRNTAQTEVTNNLRYIQEIINQKMESAVKINSISTTILSLAMASSTLNPTVFTYSNNQLLMKEGSGDNLILNTDKTEITDFAFALSTPKDLEIDDYYHMARNPNFGYIDFKNSYNQATVPVGAGDLTGLAYNKKLGWLSLNCVSNDQCSENNYKVSANASGILSGSGLFLGDGLYVDVDNNNVVSDGDRRLAVGSNLATGLGKSNWSTVSTGDGDINTALGLVLPISLVKATGTDGDFVYGTEGLYIDFDKSNSVTAKDRRIAVGNTAGKGSGYAAGSLVVSGDTDVGTALLSVITDAKVKSTDTSGDFKYSGGLENGLVNFSNVTIDLATGVFNGKATTNNIGYISFNCATGGASNDNICSSYDYKLKDKRERSSGVKMSMTVKYKTLRTDLIVNQSVNFSASLKRPSLVTVSAINPSSGANTGSVSITSITGTNFQSGAIVKLVKGGQIEINPTNNPSFTSSTQLSGGSFDLTDLLKGIWDVYVINPDGQIGVLGSGFTIN